jgi:D-alanyl-D-alanine carboxypeptidase
LLINFPALLGRSSVIARVIGASAAAVLVYAADARAASAGHDASHELPRATHESSSAPPYSAIVLDANSGKVLHSANADELRHPASLTKIMTLYLLFERLETGKLRLDTPLPVSEHAAMQAPTKLGLTPDQTIAVEDAIGGLITKSANDAAVVIAEALADDEHEFAELMNWKAHALGMSRTVYRNASGLPNDEQITTARDQALLGRAIQERFPRYYRYFAMPSFTYRGQTMHNHNHLLGQVEGLDGIKTGYTKASGFNLVTSVRRNNRHIVAVVLGGVSADARDTRMRSLIEEYIGAAAPRKSTTTTAEARQQPVDMRVTENRIREGHLAEPSTKGTRATDARPANQPTEPKIYSVASYERPVKLLSSATPPSTTRATTAAPLFAAPLADAKSDETTAGERRASATKNGSNSLRMWLPSSEADAQHNIQLLVRPWFDIPVVHGDGKWAIIPVAKDATGVRAFAQALAGWDGGAAVAAPAINRFTDAFSVWNDYETAAPAPRKTESGSLVPARR